MYQIFYSVYEQESNDFFTKQLTQIVAQKIIDTTSLLDVIPNPNNIVGCDKNDTTCWSHIAHVHFLLLKFAKQIVTLCSLQWCIYLNNANLNQLEIIKCTFGKSESVSAQDRVQQCVSDDQFVEINNCINIIANTISPVVALQSHLNQLIDKSQQESVELIVKDKSNVKAKNGVLQELCYNFFHIDDETLGCKVTKPSVVIFYETQSKTVSPVFNHMIWFGQFSPFETMAQFEFIPYGNTKDDNGNYICEMGENQCRANWIHVSRLSTI